MTIFIENASNSASNGTNTGDTFQRGIQNMSEKKMFPKTGISLFPSCSSADVCESLWYCTKDPLITVIGITATVFAITGCVANGLSVYRICTRKEHGSPTMTMITILSSSNSVSVIITYMPFLASFGHIADGVQSSLDFKIAAIISASAITISGFYVAQLSALRYLQLRYPLSSLKYITTKTRDKLHKMSHAIFYTTLLAWILHFGFIPVILVFRSNIKHPVRRNSSRYPLPVYGTNV
ncbi:uncharacterized protein LOC125682797 [Ostrea edulis]|uniref:uncharacterized protein LOC125682797 n=1 Tax=Ostrea edulis TaxID=37623 RepID=UPI0024AEF44A|nr:uncharacterized protein LOC125682797 [Ostrea edulis]